MDFQILAVRTADEDDGRLYPVPGAEKGSVAREPWDGEPLRLTGRAVVVQQLHSATWRVLQRAKDVKLDLLISDSRFVVSCARFDEGGGWVGFGGDGVMFALAENGVSRTRAAHRRHGKLLVGQVRYPWLRCVGCKPRAGWRSSEEVRLGVVACSRDGARQELFLDVALPKDVDSAAVARAIVMRAAGYRLQHTEVAEQDTVRLLELAAGPSLVASEPKKFALYELPHYELVSAESAYPQQVPAALTAPELL